MVDVEADLQESCPVNRGSYVCQWAKREAISLFQRDLIPVGMFLMLLITLSVVFYATSEWLGLYYRNPCGRFMPKMKRSCAFPKDNQCQRHSSIVSRKGADGPVTLNRLAKGLSSSGS